MANNGSSTSMLSELTVIPEYWDLVMSSVYRGQGMPRGDGRRVLVIPGLFGTDIYLRTMRTWLRRIGYTPERSSLFGNVGCSDRLVDIIDDKLPAGDDPIAIVGHSRGGMLAKALATRLGPRCSHFIALGSPVGGILRQGIDGLRALAANDGHRAANELAHQSVYRAGQRALKFLDPDCDAPHCACRYFDDLFGPLHPATKACSIYSKDDRVVSPNACPIAGATNIEVGGSHGGLAYNRAVYPHIAEALSS